MRAPFEDKSVVVTGATEGIGRAIALQLARQRARLALAARNEERLATLVAECEAAGASAVAAPCDVSVEADCRRLIATAAERLGAIDMLVANAGQTMWSTLEKLDDLAVLERLMKVNYFGAAWCAHAALPHLRQRRGRIVSIASVAGLVGVPARSGYCASKHAMVGFFDALRVELAGSGVSVTVIAPDFVVSEIHRRAIGPDGLPLGRSPMQEGKIMTAARCAELTLAAAAARRRLLVTSGRGRLARWLNLVCPGVVDRLARRAIERGH